MGARKKVKRLSTKVTAENTLTLISLGVMNTMNSNVVGCKRSNGPQTDFGKVTNHLNWAQSSEITI